MPDNTAVTVRVPLPAKHLKPSTSAAASKPESKPDVKVKAKVTVQTKFAKMKRYRTAQPSQQGDPTCQPS